MAQLEIVFENENLIVINKPHGLLVHRTPIAKDATEFALQLLRDQIGYRIYPSHRLDRKTAGLLLFAKDEETNSQMSALFSQGKVEKVYYAIVRGYSPQSGEIDYNLDDGRGPKKAITLFETLRLFEIPVAFGNYKSSRYSLVKLKPLTGRFHQLRKHMAHMRHPIIGDRPHGCNKQNKLWKEKFNRPNMFLYAASLKFKTSHTEELYIEGRPSLEFQAALNFLKLTSSSPFLL